MFKFTWEYVTRNWYKICTAALLGRPGYGLQMQCFLSRTQSESDLGPFWPKRTSAGPGHVLVLVRSWFNLRPSLPLLGQTLADYMDSLHVLFLVLHACIGTQTWQDLGPPLDESKHTKLALFFKKNGGHELFYLVLGRDNPARSLWCE